MYGELILVAGFPGCGKTTYLVEMFRRDWLPFDDFKAQAFEDVARFSSSRKLRALISALQDGVNCVAADINFCKTESREEAEHELLTEIPDLKFRWVFFENDPQACKANVRSRVGRTEQTREREVKYIDEYSPSYQIPQGAEVRPVFRSA